MALRFPLEKWTDNHKTILLNYELKAFLKVWLDHYVRWTGNIHYTNVHNNKQFSCYIRIVWYYEFLVDVLISDVLFHLFMCSIQPMWQRWKIILCGDYVLCNYLLHLWFDLWFVDGCWGPCCWLFVASCSNKIGGSQFTG